MATRGAITLLLVLATAAVSRGSVYTQLYGSYQGFDLAVAPPVGPTGDGNPNSPCYVQGVPTPDGLSPLALGPVTLDLPKGTGEHTVKLLLATGYTAVNGYISNPPSATVLRAGAESATWNANLGNVGDSGSTFYAIIYNNQQVCQLTISFKTAPAVTCGSNSGTTVDSGPGSIFYPPQNTVVVNPAAQTYVSNIAPVYQNVYSVNTQTSNYYVDQSRYISNSCTGCCYNSCNLIVNVNNTIVYPPTPALPPRSSAPIPQPTNGPSSAPRPGSATPPSSTTPPAPRPSSPPSASSPSVSNPSNPQPGPAGSPPSATPPRLSSPPATSPPAASPPSGMRTAGPPSASAPSVSNPANPANPPTQAQPPANRSPPVPPAGAPRAAPPTGQTGR